VKTANSTNTESPETPLWEDFGKSIHSTQMKKAFESRQASPSDNPAFGRDAHQNQQKASLPQPSPDSTPPPALDKDPVVRRGSKAQVTVAELAVAYVTSFKNHVPALAANSTYGLLDFRPLLTVHGKKLIHSVSVENLEALIARDGFARCSHGQTHDPGQAGNNQPNR
jgi:hypothetical protein